MKQICILLLLSILITSCNGQVKKSQTNSGATESLNKLKASTDRPPKIIRTQGALSGSVGSGLQDKAGNIWFGTSGEGAYRYDGKTFTNFTKKDGLSSNNVGPILEENDGNFLFGTGDGVYRYNGKSFSRLPIAHNNSHNLIQGMVFSMLQDKTGKLWFGTSNGVYSYDGKSFTNLLDDLTIAFVDEYRPDKKNAFYGNDGKFNPSHLNTGGTLNRNDLRLKYVASILEDKNGNIWFTSWSNDGVFRFDGRTLTRFKPNGDGMVHAILEDKAGNIWFGTKSHGACRYDGKTFTSFADIELFSKCAVFSMAEDKAGNIWFGTDGREGNDGKGVIRYDGKSFANFTTKDGLSNNNVFSILNDKDGNLWFGTRDFGLCRYDGKTFVSFSEQRPRQ